MEHYEKKQQWRWKKKKNWHAEAHEHVKQSYTGKKIERRTLNIKFLHYFCHILIDDVYTASFASSRVRDENERASNNDRGIRSWRQRKKKLISWPGAVNAF